MRKSDKPSEEGPIEPTTNRATKSEFEIVATQHATGKRSEAWRVVPTIERMHRAGQINDDELKAARDFSKYFILGQRVTGLTARYGELSGSGGTPPGQQVDRLDWRGEIRLTPDELKAMYSKLWIEGIQALDSYFLAHWIQKIVCEDYSLLEGPAPTLADCGKAFLGCKSNKQAAAAGATMIKFGLQRLVSWYSRGRGSPRRPPTKS